MTDELEAYGNGSYIEEFVSAGPKNYSYNVFSTSDQTLKSTCKVKALIGHSVHLGIIKFELICPFSAFVHSKRFNVPVLLTGYNLDKNPKHHLRCTFSLFSRVYLNMVLIRWIILFGHWPQAF
ncbi:hypothetical protein RI129_000839 [Pyrocoelia pectoralis]|uniref:Uncharacterized protein n=1 Tax=Pyrocoelia pectoralis TaxID=417401 RepID=A0AAN7VIS9_9COLE